MLQQNAFFAQWDFINFTHAKLCFVTHPGRDVVVKNICEYELFLILSRHCDEQKLKQVFNVMKYFILSPCLSQMLQNLFVARVTSLMNNLLIKISPTRCLNAMPSWCNFQEKITYMCQCLHVNVSVSIMRLLFDHPQNLSQSTRS